MDPCYKVRWVRQGCPPPSLLFITLYVSLQSVSSWEGPGFVPEQCYCTLAREDNASLHPALGSQQSRQKVVAQALGHLFSAPV